MSEPYVFGATNKSKIDTVEIEKHGEGYKVLSIKDNVVVNFYHAQNLIMASNIARAQMDRLGDL